MSTSVALSGRTALAAAYLLALGAAIAGSPACLQGQGFGPTGGIEVRVTSDRTELPVPNVRDFDRGFIERGDGPFTLRVDAQGRRPWRLFVSSADPDLGGSGKPLRHLLLRIRGGGDWTPLTNSPSRVATGCGSERLALDVRVLLDYASDAPARYGTALEFRAEAIPGASSCSRG